MGSKQRGFMLRLGFQITPEACLLYSGGRNGSKGAYFTNGSATLFCHLWSPWCRQEGVHRLGSQMEELAGTVSILGLEWEPWTVSVIH